METTVMGGSLTCRDERRRAVRVQAMGYQGLNGIDYVEVVQGSGQLELCVHFFGDVPECLKKKNVRIEGGTRIRDIEVLDIEPRKSADPEQEDCLRVLVNKPGDFSCYKLCLYRNPRGDDGPCNKFFDRLDPRYACAEFSFKTECPSELDCRDDDDCPAPRGEAPEINYLARDYASFRQLLLDRLALLVPDWRERHVPDIGIALVEILAYVGDHLSYYQDAVATEAYLDTARNRMSVRRHCRLVDYLMHEGCNARTWISMETDTDAELDAGEFYFITRTPELVRYGSNPISEDDLRELRIAAGSYEIFEPMVKKTDRETPSVRVYKDHNKIDFYTWANSECCLERGATRATLKGKLADDGPARAYAQDPKKTSAAKAAKPPSSEARPPQLYLKPGSVLIFEEVLGAKTGNRADADPKRRWAVRLTAVRPDLDPLTKTDVVEIEWAKADALPFELCISARQKAPGCEYLEGISVAWGNVVLADHGRTLAAAEDCGEAQVAETVGECACEGSDVEFTYTARKFLPKLERIPLTYSQPASFDAPASLQIAQDPRSALPSVVLEGTSADIDKKTAKWYPKIDLLDSAPDERSFVVEIDNDGRANLRFGDDECGRMPEAGTAFTAKYRTGNGIPGNVGADTIAYMVTTKILGGILITPRNPLAAAGGVNAEPVSEAKLFAPGAFRKERRRAITADDYAELAMRNGEIQGASAQLRWSGSWREACVSIDPFATEEFDEDLQERIERLLRPYCRMGHDLRVTRSRYVPLLIELGVGVRPDFLRGHVEAALREVFSSRILPDGRPGFFHPDKLKFGSPVYLSALVAAARGVEGIFSVDVTRLERYFEGSNSEVENGVLPIGPNEIAQLDNDPSFPERGKLIFNMRGGR